MTGDESPHTRKTLSLLARLLCFLRDPVSLAFGRFSGLPLFGLRHGSLWEVKRISLVPVKVVDAERFCAVLHDPLCRTVSLKFEN